MEINFSIKELLNPLIERANVILTNLMPTGEIYVVLLASGLIAYYIKNKYDWGKIAFLITTIVIYSSFRYFGIGG